MTFYRFLYQCIFLYFFPFILALTLVELILLFSIDHQGIKLTLNYSSGAFVWCLRCYKSHRFMQDVLWTQTRSGRRHSVRSLHRRLRQLILHFQLSPTQQEGHGILTKLYKDNRRQIRLLDMQTLIVTALLQCISCTSLKGATTQ